MPLLATACLKLDRRAQENLPPSAAIAVAPGALVGPLTTVILDGSTSADPEERPLTFRWTQASGDLVVLDDPGAATVSFTAPERAQSLVFSLVVSDGRFDSAAATVQLRVSTNAGPTAVVAPVGQAIAGATIAIDGSASSDPEAQTLSYTWTSPSHPALVFSPSATVAQPSIVVPADLSKPLVVRLTVSDGALSHSAEATAPIEPGDSTAIFVDANAGCTSDCDGTRAKPFKQVMLGYGKAKTELKPVLVAPGYYQRLAMDSPVTIIGRCDPANGWACGVTAQPSVIAASESERFAVLIPAPNDTPIVLRHLHILGTTGQMPLEAKTGTMGNEIGALYCAGCSVVVDRSYLDVNAAGGDAGDLSRVVSINTTPRAVRIIDSTIVMGRTGNNEGVYVGGSFDVELHGVTIRSKNDVRNGQSSAVKYNYLLFAHGPSHVVVDRSRFEVDAGAEHKKAYAVEIRDNGNVGVPAPIVLATANVFWFKGFASNWGPTEGQPGDGTRRSDGNLMVHATNVTNATFVNNTFIGNAAAAVPGCLPDIGGGAMPHTINPKDEACLGLALFLGGGGTSRLAFVNNYFTTLYRLVWNAGSPDLFVTFKNNTVDPNIPVISDGQDLDPTADVNVLHDGHLGGGLGEYGASDQLGEANVRGDCLLKDPATGDAHLLAGSPCIDSGAFDRDAPARDIDGDDRPAGTTIDRGADEVTP